MKTSRSLNDFSAQKVLVTGANGFIGTHTVELLQSKNISVRVLVRNKGKLKPALLPQVELIEGDICNVDVVRQALRGMDAVIHTAAYVSDFALDEAVYYQTNFEGTKNIVDAAVEESRLRRFRLVHFSTAGVLPAIRGKTVDDRMGYDPKPHSAYRKSKIAGEKYLFDRFQNELDCGNPQFEVVALRPTFVFGPGDPTFFPGLIQALKAGTPLLIGGPSKMVHLLCIENLMGIVWKALTESELVGKGYICDDGARTWGWIVDKALDAFQIRRPKLLTIPRFVALSASHVFVKWARIRKRSNRPDITPFVIRELFSDLAYSDSVLRDQAHYRPKISIEEGMKKALQYFIEHPESLMTTK